VEAADRRDLLGVPGAGAHREPGTHAVADGGDPAVGDTIDPAQRREVRRDVRHRPGRG
jgi:hypothetical protein